MFEGDSALKLSACCIPTEYTFTAGLSLCSVWFPKVNILLAIVIVLLLYKGASFKKRSILHGKIRDQESRLVELPTVHPFPAVIMMAMLGQEKSEHLWEGSGVHRPLGPIGDEEHIRLPFSERNEPQKKNVRNEKTS